MTELCVAFKAHQGWVNAVAVDLDARLPTPVWSGRVELCDGSDREAIEPYHVAGGWHGLQRGVPPADPVAIIERGRRKQVTAARAQLNALRQRLRAEGHRWSQAVVLTGRGRQSDGLHRILDSHTQIHVAEGEAIRHATRTALRALAIVCVDRDEKDVVAVANRLLCCTDADAYMKGRRPAGARSWRKEERVAALAAWLNRN